MPSCTALTFSRRHWSESYSLATAICRRIAWVETSMVGTAIRLAGP